MKKLKKKIRNSRRRMKHRSFNWTKFWGIIFVFFVVWVIGYLKPENTSSIEEIGIINE